jgi:hypothetical protein
MEYPRGVYRFAVKQLADDGGTMNSNPNPAVHGHAGNHHPGADLDPTAGSAGLTRMAVIATAHCLTGCAIGEVLGLALGTALGWSNPPTILIAIVLAFVFGYGLTMAPLLRGGLSARAALSVALAADTLSVLVMEVMDNATVLLIPGAMDAGLDSALFWGSLVVALGVAFVVTVPVNRALISRGRGHAVVHQHH